MVYPALLPLMRAHLSCQQSTELTPPAILNGIVRFAERRNLVSARAPSNFNCGLPVVPSLKRRLGKEEKNLCSVADIKK
jgi:hypothetical protein